MKQKNYNTTILELNRKWAGTKYQPLVEKAMEAYVNDDYKTLDATIAGLPDELQLLEKLVNKLEGKSVYTNLKKLLENKETSSVEQELISTASLIVHAGIELKENKEYKFLLPDLYKKLGVIINKL